MHLNPFSNLHYFVVCVVLLPPPHSALLAPLLHDCDNYSSTSTIGGSSTRHGRTRYPQRCAMPCSPHVRPVHGCRRQRLGCGRCTLATNSPPHYRGQSALSDRPDLAFLLSAQTVTFEIEPKYGIQSLLFHTPGGCMYPMPRETSSGPPRAYVARHFCCENHRPEHCPTPVVVATVTLGRSLLALWPLVQSRRRQPVAHIVFLERNAVPISYQPCPRPTRSGRGHRWWRNMPL